MSGFAWNCIAIVADDKNQIYSENQFQFKYVQIIKLKAELTADF